METRLQRQRKQCSWGLFALEGKHLCSTLKTPPEESFCLIPLSPTYTHHSLCQTKGYTPLSTHIPQKVLCTGINSLNKHPDLMPQLSSHLGNSGASRLVCTQKKAHLDSAWGCRPVLCWLFEGSHHLANPSSKALISEGRAETACKGCF